MAHASNAKKVFQILVAIVAWFAIVLQAYLTTGSMGNFFSYFTIQSNILVALMFTATLSGKQTFAVEFFSKPSVQSAICLYIFIVALVYNTILRGLFPLDGWNLFVDTLLHVVVPFLVIVYWFLYVPKGVLQFKDGLSWIIFPFIYLIYSMIRGSVMGWYPYPFLNAVKLGYSKVFLNVGIMITVFFIAGLALIQLNKTLNKAGISEGPGH